MHARAIRRNIALFYANSFMVSFLLWGGIWLKYLIVDRGLELRWILLMDLPFWLVVAALQAPTGALADHIGRKRVIALSGVLYSVTILGFGFTTNYWMLFADYVLWGVAQATQSGADQALLYDTLKHGKQEKRFQKVAGRGFALGLGAATVSLALGGWVAHLTSLAFVVQISAVFPLIGAVIAMSMVEPPVARQIERHYWRDMGDAFSFAWATPQVRYTLLLGGLLMTATFGPVVLVQPFLLAFDTPDSLFSVLQVPLRLLAVGGSLAAFWVSARLGVPKLLLLACSTAIGAYFGLAFIDSPVAFAFFALPAVVQGLFNPAISAHLNERIPSEKRATVLSLMPLIFALQVAFFEPLLGFFADSLSLFWAFGFAGAYCLVLMPPVVILWRRAHGVISKLELKPIVEPAVTPGA